MLLADLVRLNARKRPHATALRFAERTVTFAQLEQRCDRLAAGLLGLAEPGGRVAILMENRPEFVECYYGVPAAGMGLVFCNYRLHPRELAGIIADSGATVVVVEAAYRPVLDQVRTELPAVRHVVCCDEPVAGELGYEAVLAGADPSPPAPAVSEDSLAWLIYTSGTTGRPKGAMLSHRNLGTAVLNSGLAWNHEPDTVSLFPWPLCHVSGYSILVSHLFGDAVVLMRGFDPEDFLGHIQRHRVTRTSMAPTMLNLLLTHPAFDDHDLSSLRGIGYGAAAMPLEVLREAMERLPGVEFTTGFGMTELAGNVMYLSAQAHRDAVAGDAGPLASVGGPMPLAVVRVVDDELRDVAVGEVGEVVVRGEQVTMGYWADPEATAEAFAGGWFHSGDVGRWDESGNLYIVDRKKDMILTGGENVYSREVEEVLYQHPAVAEAAVIGVPDPTWGENVVAVIQPRSGATVDPEDLIAFCRDHLAGYKKPKQVFVVDELPRNAAGKILKRELRDQVSAGSL